MKQQDRAYTSHMIREAFDILLISLEYIENETFGTKIDSNKKMTHFKSI